MSIGANWRQISPGAVPGASDATGNKFAQSDAADQLSDASEGRSFSEYMFGKDGFDFTDVLDVINPLQHIPGVGMIYRSLTGDELGNGARVVGGGLFGGVFGLAGAAIDAVVDAVTGEDTGAHVMAFVEEGFGGGSTDQGTAIADASNPAASSAETASFDGRYQGELVLPWMAGTQPVSVSASPEEQATIVQSAPTSPVDQAMLASTGVNASDLNVPWGQATAKAPAQAVNNPLLQAQLSAQKQTPETEIAQLETDPAELTVAMASAGTTNPASTVAQTISASSQNSETMRRASLSSEGGNTVWARAQSGGRLSRQENSFAISPEIAAREARAAKLNQAKEEAENSKSVNPSIAGNGPLSAAEMAARFNAALGRDKAQTMAAEAVASSNAVADQGRMTTRQASLNDDRSTNSVTNADSEPETHPLMQRASSHIGTEEPVGAWFSQTMMDGLKKYQAMQMQNGKAGNTI
ncbi:hypothetical protein [uncultured Thalassospira sp.]|uniref:hypothetical protein n=1 Tax=uncultured Thalassospira sp. TaxID=404382 RepID=UPI0025880A10|nr:hypothetical protein [uncultured Thalassospira sp.]